MLIYLEFVVFGWWSAVWACSSTSYGQNTVPNSNVLWKKEFRKVGHG